MRNSQDRGVGGAVEGRRPHREHLAKVFGVAPFLLLLLTLNRSLMDKIEHALDAVAPTYGLALLTLLLGAVLGAMLAFAVSLSARPSHH